MTVSDIPKWAEKQLRHAIYECYGPWLRMPLKFIQERPEDRPAPFMMTAIWLEQLQKFRLLSGVSIRDTMDALLVSSAHEGDQVAAQIARIWMNRYKGYLVMWEDLEQLWRDYEGRYRIALITKHGYGICDFETQTWNIRLAARVKGTGSAVDFMTGDWRKGKAV